MKELPIFKEYVLSDGTPLWDKSEKWLNENLVSFRKRMEIAGKTAHYRRKNKSTIEIIDSNTRNIKAELERRRQLTRINVFGMEGYVQSISAPKIIAQWPAEEYRGQFQEDIYPVIRLDNEWVSCPKGKEPTHYFLYDVIYTVKWDYTVSMSGRMISWAGESTRYPGKVFKRMIAAGATMEELSDPLEPDAPWKVLDGEVD